VATYLAPISRILFAVAITPPISPYETIMARSRSKKEKNPSIAGTDWVTLDFGQIEKELAAKLSDDDVRDVLLHINAANKLKKLLLTNCTNITGAGIRPLRGSTTIEQIDLSLVGKFQSPNAASAFIAARISFSCKIVLPILDSIISNGALCKLKYLHFPYVWRVKALEMWENAYVSTLERLEAQLASEGVDTGSSPEIDFHAFLVRYNQMLEERGRISCLKCNQEVTEYYHQPRIALENTNYNCCNYYGTQNNFCHQCSNYYCRRCPTENNNLVHHHFCSACEREYCENCVTMRACGICEEMFCSDSCLPYSCASCDEKLCGKCKVDSACIKCNRTWCAVACYRACPECEGCNKTCCVECSKEDKANEVFYCDDCSDGYYCNTCLLDEALEEGNIDCQSCMKRVTPLILEQNKRLKDENKKLKDANKGLKEMNMNQSKLIQDLRESKQNS
jgi:hypothetical protein